MTEPEPKPKSWPMWMTLAAVIAGTNLLLACGGSKEPRDVVLTYYVRVVEDPAKTNFDPLYEKVRKMMDAAGVNTWDFSYQPTHIKASLFQVTPEDVRNTRKKIERSSYAKELKLRFKEQEVVDPGK